MKRLARGLVFLFFSFFAGSSFGQFTFTDFCDVSDFTLNGITGSLSPNGDCVLRLTNDFAQSGSAFLTNPVSLAGDASFSTAFSFQFTNQQGGGADGIVFVVQTVANDVGGGGGGIGYAGIADSVGVEFDNWFNGGADPDNSHIGIDLEGSVFSVVTASVSPDLDNGAVWYAWVDYNGVTDLLEVRISETSARPDTADLSHTVDLVTVLGQTDAFIGFTSGTGAASAWHDVLSWAFNPDFDPIGGGPVPARATFAVEKFFDDGNPTEVEVTLSCNTGLPLQQSTMISEGDGVNFVVVDFDDGTMDCEVTETAGADGYTVQYDDGSSSLENCEFTNVNFGDAHACRIDNLLQTLDVVVTKWWMSEGPDHPAPNIASAYYECFGEQFFQVFGYLDFFGDGDADSFDVAPHWNGNTTCDVTEVVVENGVEWDDSECQGLSVTPGNGASCNIYNTRLFEGIPTLSRHGLGLLAMLMLVLGLVAYRRMA